MKKTIAIIASALLALGAVGCKKNADTTAVSEKDSIALSMGILYGQDFANQFEMSRLQGQPIDSVAFLEGFKSGIDTTRFSYNLGAIYASNIARQLAHDSIDIDKFYAAMRAALLKDTVSIAMKPADAQAFMQRIQAKKQRENNMKQFGQNIEKGNEYIDTFKKEDGVTVTTSGLAYKTLQEGTGATPSLADTVRVKYVGTLVDGKEFDKNEEGIEFAVTGVIKGWTEMLQLMKVGQKVRVVIPQELAYGETGNYTIEPFSTLTFEMELIGIKPGKK